MRADRLISIILLLQNHSRLTAGELAKKLEVSERTIHRDMEVLSASGVPVIADRGNNGGWSLVGGYETKLNGLNEQEIRTLFVPPSSKVMEDLGLGEASRAAMIKLISALPSQFQKDADLSKQRVYVDSSGWKRDQEGIEKIPVLQEAIWNDKKIKLLYRKDRDTVVERIINPLGLVAKGSVWYVVASVDDGIRTYRVSRIEDVTVLDESFERPFSFDLASYWKQSTSEFVSNLPTYTATISVSPYLLSRLPYSGKYVRVKEHVDQTENGWTTIVAEFETEENACENIISFGTNVKVIQPDTLRDKVIELARRVIRFYEER